MEVDASAAKADYVPPFPGAGIIFYCLWCRRPIYVEHAHHYRIKGGCESYWRHREAAYLNEMGREGK